MTVLLPLLFNALMKKMENKMINLNTRFKKIAVDMLIILVVGGVFFGTAKAFLGNWELTGFGDLNGYDLPKEYSELIISETDPMRYKPFDFCFKDTKTVYSFAITDKLKSSGVTRRFMTFECR